MSFWRGLFSGATPTGQNVANAVMMRRQKEMDDKRRAEERQWAIDDQNTAYQNQLGIIDKQGENATNLAGINNQAELDRQLQRQEFQLDLFDAQGNLDLEKLELQHKNASKQIAQQNANYLKRMQKQFGHDSEQAKIAREFQGYQKAAERQFQQWQNTLNRDLQQGKIKSQEEYQQMALKQQRMLGILNALPQMLLLFEENPALMEQLKVSMQNLIAPPDTSSDGGDLRTELNNILNPEQTDSASAEIPSETPASRLGIQQPENEWSRLNNYSVGYKVNPKIAKWFGDNFKASWDKPYVKWNE